MDEEKKQLKLTRKEVKKQLNDIIELFHKIPKIKNKETLKKIIDKTEGNFIKNKTEDNLQELIDYLRISVKYTLFDIEALKRENKDLKKLLGDKDK